MEETPDSEGLFSYVLPKSKREVKFRLLTIGDQKELDKFISQYPKGMTAPSSTKKLEKQHIESIQTLRAAFAKNASDLGYISI